MSGFILDTPLAIRIFQLKSQIAMVKLESHGMTHSGGAAKPRICKALGISTRTPHHKVLELLGNELLKVRTEYMEANQS